uniref:diacylglycerol O-acyltransferase n=1 Tax=Kalanchoe fedtschenkoi TaxID=63787 RepID=A0A7N0T4J1_KALFE
MKWVRTQVDLSNHVRIPKIDVNMNISPDKIVEDYVSNLTKTSLDMSKPLWDLHLLNIKTSQAEATGVFRIHHSMGDGTSLMSLLLACTRQMANPQALPTIPTALKDRKCRQLGFGGCFWNLQKMLWNTLVDIVMFMCTALFLKDTTTPLTGPPGVEFTPRRFVHRTVSLEDMKLIKNHLNATINDVALGVTEAGLSRYLNRKYGELQKKDAGSFENQNYLPKKIRMRSTLLINLRPAGIQDLAKSLKLIKDAVAAKVQN